MNPFVEDFKRAWHKPNSVIIRLIIINVAVFLVFMIAKVIGMASSSPTIYVFLRTAMYIPAPIAEFMMRPWTLLTYFFTHEDLFHIAFNMFAFYWFGRIAEEYLGHIKTLVIYIYGGIMGGLLYLIMYNTLPFFISIQPAIGMIGASASVYAIITATATLLPNYGLHLLFFGRVELKYIAAFVILLSFIGSVGSNAGGNIAHLGGALMGFIIIQMHRKGYDLGYPLTRLLTFFDELFRKITQKNDRRRKKSTSKVKSKVKNKAGKAQADATSEAPNQDEIDAILDKISQKGYESLTRKEKEILFKASQK